MSKTPKLELKSGYSGLQVSGLSKSYKKKPIIRNINLKLYKGEAIALLGPNGSGKTTCFYSIAGLVNSDMGSVVIDGRDVTNLPMYRRARLGIGYLPQDCLLYTSDAADE